MKGGNKGCGTSKATSNNCFNEAALHEGRKSIVLTKELFRLRGFNEAALHEGRKSDILHTSSPPRRQLQ